MSGSADRIAVIDIGSNSTRMLVADVADGRVEEVDRRTRVTRLARGVDLTGRLSTEAIEAVCDTVSEYVDRYEELGAGPGTVIATSAVRDAENGSAFMAELRERFALSPRILDGDEEAELTYRGATSEETPTEPTLVIDIGGGSTELVVGHDGSVDFHASLQLGVVRHTERHLSSDPSAATQLEALAGDVRGLLDAELSSQAGAEAERGIAVAGTPTSLAAIDLELDPYDPERVHGHVLGLEKIQRLLSRLAATPLEERAAIPGLHPDRAPTIVAGVVILIEVMRSFGLAELKVSERDILHGAALEAVGEAA
jgi:exopolyphosphatase/guanosine-5'-triphosphate,3'-diphosphate pyrophosphatase